MKTIVVNLYGGPGTGKSTNAALAFGKLKEAGVNAELVQEFAKDVVWEGRRVIACQEYIFGKQLWRIERLQDQVDVIVTDSPLLMSLIYAKHLGGAWAEVVRSRHRATNPLDIFLVRDNMEHPYNPKGRYQKTVEEAEVLDRQIREMLAEEWGMSVIEVPVKDASDAIVKHTLRALTAR